MSALPGTKGRRRIYLMRHGHVDYFSEEVRQNGLEAVRLTDLGRDQVSAAGKALSHIAFDKVISSGLPRTQESAEIVVAHSEVAQIDIEQRLSLKEIGSGSLTGAADRDSLADKMMDYFYQAHEPGATFLHEGELFSEAYERSVSEIETLLFEPNWHTSLVVAHEVINRLLLGWATGNGLQAIQSFEQDLACINVLDFDLAPSPVDESEVAIQRKIIKAVNMTPYNFTKHGMNLTSLEHIFQDL